MVNYVEFSGKCEQLIDELFSVKSLTEKANLIAN